MRTTRLERDQAQGECVSFLRKLGWAKKNIDAVFCTRCRRPVIESTDRGTPDYVAIINGKGLFVEVKAARVTPSIRYAERFDFTEIEDERWQWMETNTARGGCTAWFWLQIGAERVNTVGQFPRQIFLVPWQKLHAIMLYGRNLRTNLLPLNEAAAQTRVEVRNNGYWAVNNLSDYALVWERGGWSLPEGHPFGIAFRAGVNGSPAALDASAIGA